jgi:hypothetical protein
MQSIIQYRRLGQKAKEQYYRHTLDQEKPTRPSSNHGVPSQSRGTDFTKDELSLEARTPSRRRDAGREEEAQEDIENEQMDCPFREFSGVGHNLSRTNTQATSRSIGTRLGTALTGIDARERRTNEGGPEAGKAFVVGFEGEDDPLKPHNWSLMARIGATMLIASIGFVVGVASSIDSPATRQAAQEFGVSEVVEVLATGIYLIGFGVGALFAGPFSETLGRNP